MAHSTNRKKIKTMRTCPFCKTRFSPKDSWHYFCNTSCWSNWRIDLESVFLKPSESPEGSEQPVVHPTRSEEGQWDAETAKRESRAVSPVEAEANKLRRLVGHWKAMAAQMAEDGRMASDARNYLAAARCVAMAEAVRMCAADVLARLPKPESEQGEKAGDGKQSQESPEADADSNHGTASGRRNANILP